MKQWLAPIAVSLTIAGVAVAHADPPFEQQEPDPDRQVTINGTITGKFRCHAEVYRHDGRYDLRHAVCKLRPR